MARQRSKKLSRDRNSDQQPALAAKYEEDREDAASETGEIMEKDEEEDELDRLVLGNESAFMAQLHQEAMSDEIQDLEEVELEAEVGLDDGEEGLEGVDDADLFFLDDVPSAIDEKSLAPLALASSGDEPSRHTNEAAWEDSDDERLMVSLAGNQRMRKLRVNEADDMVTGVEYTRRLRKQFERLNPAPEWALASRRPAKRRRRSSASSSFSASSNDMDINDRELSTLPLARLLQSADSLDRVPATKPTKLRSEVIDIQRTRDIPTTNLSAIISLSFHPQYPVLLSSGVASTLYLHHIAPTALPTPNPPLTSVHVSSTPLYTSAFLPPDGDKIFFAGRRRFFHTWDLESGTIQKVTRVYGHNEEHKSMERFKLSPCGRYMGLVGSGRKGGGVVNVLDANTSQWIAAARIEGRRGVADFAWWSDGEGFTIAGRGGEVGEWSMQSRSFLALWNDEGAVGTTVLALGGRTGRAELGGDRWVAVGSSSGVVNIYDRRPWAEKVTEIPSHPEPTERFMQLITATSILQFSLDGQLLIFASMFKRDALRLVHLPSCTVYRNWPTSQTPLGKITAVAFSSGSDMLAVANEQGKIRLWEIRA